MSKQHTPGPWYAVKVGCEFSDITTNRRRRLRFGENTIAQCVNHEDAALIASAPLLLKSLDEAAEWLHSALAECPEDFYNSGLRRVVRKVDKAIAKARGQS